MQSIRFKAETPRLKGCKADGNAQCQGVVNEMPDSLSLDVFLFFFGDGDVSRTGMSSPAFRLFMFDTVW